MYDVPSKFTSELLDVEVDVRQTTMEELERRALGAEIVFHKFLLDDVSGTSLRLGGDARVWMREPYWNGPLVHLAVSRCGR